MGKTAGCFRQQTNAQTAITVGTRLVKIDNYQENIKVRRKTNY